MRTRTPQVEDQVQDEGENRHLVFGYLYLAVAPFLNYSLLLVDPTLSG